MKVKWLGQAAFLITSDAGTRIITDHYATNERLTYSEIEEWADAVTVSHGHFDHSNVAAVRGNPTVIKGNGEVKGIKFEAVGAFHDNARGSQRGNITIFCFEVDGIRVCHLGDLGHQLSEQQAKVLGRVDVLLIPVGGNFTIDAKTATEVCEKLKPRIAIPMHYRNERCPNFPVAGVDDFLKGKSNVTRLDVSEVEFKPDALHGITQIVVLKPAL